MSPSLELVADFSLLSDHAMLSFFINRFQDIFRLVLLSKIFFLSSITNVNHPNAINNSAKDLWKGLTYDYQEHVTISSNDSSGRSDNSNEADIRKKLYIEDLTTRKDVYGLCENRLTAKELYQTLHKLDIERHQTNSDIQIQMQKYISVRVDKLNCNSNDNQFKITQTHSQAIYTTLDSLQINDE
ncbi:7134_t:CDS:2, partial [Funneliformis caledonium]